MAPSTTSALYRECPPHIPLTSPSTSRLTLSAIVIPALHIPPHFTTLGAGLLFDSHAREIAPTLRALLLSSPPLLENKAKPKSWWRAQCLLYGLDAPEKRTVQELRAALELMLLKGELEVPAAMAQLETREKGRFRKLNAQVRDATGVGAEKPKEVVKKAPANPAKKPRPKDPLVAVRNAGKVAKSQPVTKNKSVTVNLTINMPSASAAPAKNPARAKAKPRAQKNQIKR